MQKQTEEMDRGVLNVSQRAFLLKAKKYFYIQAFMRVGIRLGVCMVWFSLFSLLLSCIKNKKNGGLNVQKLLCVPLEPSVNPEPGPFTPQVHVRVFSLHLKNH